MFYWRNRFDPAVVVYLKGEFPMACGDNATVAYQEPGRPAYPVTRVVGGRLNEHEQSGATQYNPADKPVKEASDSRPFVDRLMAETTQTCVITAERGYSYWRIQGTIALSRLPDLLRDVFIDWVSDTVNHPERIRVYENKSIDAVNLFLEEQYRDAVATRAENLNARAWASEEHERLELSESQRDDAVQQVYSLEMQVAELQRRNDTQFTTIAAFIQAREASEAALRTLANL